MHARGWHAAAPVRDAAERWSPRKPVEINWPEGMDEEERENLRGALIAYDEALKDFEADHRIVFPSDAERTPGPLVSAANLHLRKVFQTSFRVARSTPGQA